MCHQYGTKEDILEGLSYLSIDVILCHDTLKGSLVWIRLPPASNSSRDPLLRVRGLSMIYHNGRKKVCQEDPKSPNLGLFLILNPVPVLLGQPDPHAKKPFGNPSMDIKQLHNDPAYPVKLTTKEGVELEFLGLSKVEVLAGLITAHQGISPERAVNKAEGILKVCFEKRNS